MRLNKYIAACTEYSRRKADELIATGRVTINGTAAGTGTAVSDNDVVSIDGHTLVPRAVHTTIILNKPTGYVCSRKGQGSKTIYELLPDTYQHLQPVGRLDKDSSGLLLLTDDGDLANQLTHPKYGKTKVYRVTLDTPLQPLHQQMIADHGVMLEDGLSRFMISKDGEVLTVTMREGRNRQIRRTFQSLGYTVRTLQRTHFGTYPLDDLAEGEYRAS